MATNSPKIFQYMKIIGHLKQVERTGWVRKHIKDPESVAEHMYRMAMMAFAIPANSELDRDKCIKMALVHDMSESIVGDITPWCGVTKGEKQKMENEATTHIASFLPEETGKEMYQLWLEYENQSSPEAKFVKDLDKFEMLLQAYEYEQMYSRPGHLQDFYDHTRDRHKFKTQLVKEWTTELEQQRKETMAKSATAVVSPGPDANDKIIDLHKTIGPYNQDEPQEGKQQRVMSSLSVSSPATTSSPVIKKRRIETTDSESIKK